MVITNYIVVILDPNMFVKIELYSFITKRDVELEKYHY